MHLTFDVKFTVLYTKKGFLGICWQLVNTDIGTDKSKNIVQGIKSVRGRL